MIWNHDGSLYSFLTAVFKVFEVRDGAAEIFGPISPHGDLFADSVSTPEVPDELLAKRVLEGVKKYGGVEAQSRVGEAFLSEDPAREEVILAFIRLCVNWGQSSLDRKTDPIIMAIEKMAQRTRRECHCFLGILRFQELAGNAGLYAPFSPETNVLPLLVPHFSDRLGTIPWMIHDVKRGIAAASRPGSVEFFHEIKIENGPEISPDEDGFQALWKGFFKAVAVPGRTNHKLQMSKLPKKYWGHLTEKQV